MVLAGSINKQIVGYINAAGGKMKEGAKGVDENEYLPAAKLVVMEEEVADASLVAKE